MAAVAVQDAASPTTQGRQRSLSAAAPKKQAKSASVVDAQAGSVQELILSCNKDGMESLRAGNQKAAFDQFKYAEAVLLANQMGTDTTALLAVTCNNLGCYFKKVGKFHGSLNYLRRALKMEVELKTDEVTLAGTHLNLVSVLSKLEKHDKAVQHALCALELMGKRVTNSQEVVTEEDYTVLAVAYHNLGIEREFLQQWDLAAQAFQTGHQVAKRFLGTDHMLATVLNQNCDAVIKKAKKKIKAPGRPHNQTAAGRLPEIPATPRGNGSDSGSRPGTAGGDALPPLTPGSRGIAAQARKEVKDWASQERDQWAVFASKTLQGTTAYDRTDTATPPGSARGLTRSEAADAAGARASTAPLGAGARSPFSSQAGSLADDRFGGVQTQSIVQQKIPRQLLELEEMTKMLPQGRNMGHHKFEEKACHGYLPKPPLVRALNDHPEKLMDIIDVEGQGHGALRLAANDYRPNRSMNRSTRCSRMVRRTGVHNSSLHRDRVSADGEKRRAHAAQPGKTKEAQKQAAERIQRVWRSWYNYCQENSEYMTMTWICATMIQSQWRSYHVRRMKMDKNALQIQRHVRGWLVRSVLKNHAAAVTIQRRTVGMLTRMKMLKLHQACMRIQRAVRGHIARRNFRAQLAFMRGVCTTIQRNMRVCIVKRMFRKMVAEKRAGDLKLKSVIDFQRYFRGYKGRQYAEATRQAAIRNQRTYDAATLIQCHTRRMFACGKADVLREKRLRAMERASTVLRKMYLGHQVRKRYKSLLHDFCLASDQIVCIQRFIRGFVCRSRLFRQAVRAEEELWAAVEMQRAWRGYRGRVGFEHRYEAMWNREMAAAVIQRHIRGGLARRRTTKVKRKIARDQFEKARARFRGAQRIQALARGMLARRAVHPRRDLCRRAAAHIQKIHRGHALRALLWQQVTEQRATMISAVVRGFLVRRRRDKVLAAAVFLQRAWRKWLNVPRFFRQKRAEKAAHRRKMVRVIQGHYRTFASLKRVDQVKASGFLAVTNSDAVH